MPGMRAGYRSYLLVERGLREVTVDSYEPAARLLLSGVGGA